MEGKMKTRHTSMPIIPSLSLEQQRFLAKNAARCRAAFACRHCTLQASARPRPIAKPTPKPMRKPASGEKAALRSLALQAHALQARLSIIKLEARVRRERRRQFLAKMFVLYPDYVSQWLLTKSSRKQLG